ncbi:Collagen triple helix repeat [Candidatus Nanopelagicaceae bacterium]
MKKIVFFLLFLAFTRVGFAAGLSPNPVGIGNFFLGTPKFTDSNFNQVLGLLVGPTGQPGAAGVSGANGQDGAPGSSGLNGLPGIAGFNGINGTNGLNGADGRDGVPGIAGVNGVNGAQGPAGPAGPAGAPGGADFVGVGGGSVRLGTCDQQVQVSATQTFKGTYFGLQELNVSGIDSGCAGQNLTIYLPVKDGANYKNRSCTILLTLGLIAEPKVKFDSVTCDGKFDGINMSDIGDNIGLEINGGV